MTSDRDKFHHLFCSKLILSYLTLEPFIDKTSTFSPYIAIIAYIITTLNPLSPQLSWTGTQSTENSFFWSFFLHTYSPIGHQDITSRRIGREVHTPHNLKWMSMETSQMQRDPLKNTSPNAPLTVPTSRMDSDTMTALLCWWSYPAWYVHPFWGLDLFNVSFFFTSSILFLRILKFESTMFADFPVINPNTTRGKNMITN